LKTTRERLSFGCWERVANPKEPLASSYKGGIRDARGGAAAVRSLQSRKESQHISGCSP